MRLPKSFETSIYVLLILATQEQHQPVTSANLSRLLKVSDSSLKKTLRKLVVADLISSDVKRDGGFTLQQPITTITLADVLQAVETEPIISYDSPVAAESIFPHTQHVQQTTHLLDQTLATGTEAFLNQLRTITLAQLLEPDAFQNGVINWQTK